MKTAPSFGTWGSVVHGMVKVRCACPCRTIHSISVKSPVSQSRVTKKYGSEIDSKSVKC